MAGLCVSGVATCVTVEVEEECKLHRGRTARTKAVIGAVIAATFPIYINRVVPVRHRVGDDLTNFSQDRPNIATAARHGSVNEVAKVGDSRAYLSVGAGVLIRGLRVI